jgi:hypothetical protein
MRFAIDFDGETIGLGVVVNLKRRHINLDLLLWRVWIYFGKAGAQ